MSLTVRDLRKHYLMGNGFLGGPPKAIRAIDGVSFDVPDGMSVGLVGESGCGKSTVARSILRLVEPDAGNVAFGGIDVRQAKGRDLLTLRRRMQIVFQDPYSSLNPRRTVRQTLAEPLHVHKLARGREVEERIRAAVEEVGLRADALDRFPHEFSGGQRQRVGIARALIVDPEILIADEPVSALDVSVQAQILKVMEDLRKRRNLSFLFVSHDLGVVRHFCEQTHVMYLGRIVEAGATQDLLDAPAHPYTRLLRDSSPVPDPSNRLVLTKMGGEIPSPTDQPVGCGFRSRCPRAQALCETLRPELSPVAARDGAAACHFPISEV